MRLPVLVASSVADGCVTGGHSVGPLVVVTLVFSLSAWTGAGKPGSPVAVPRQHAIMEV
ncbi:hypothetical protein [Acetobacter fallax]|uniref:hypothetical protein n=1 Tax=Acetobacter fallax TaxID=1737473 RepID=UPI001F55812E|nr:hypothetical protein [Acetobacter fallax]